MAAVLATKFYKAATFLLLNGFLLRTGESFFQSYLKRNLGP